MKKPVTFAGAAKSVDVVKASVGLPKTKQKVQGTNQDPPIPPYRGVEGGPFYRRNPDGKREDQVEQAMALVESMPVDMRKKLLDRLALENLSSSSTKDQSRDKDMWGVAVYEALQAVLGAGDGVGVGPLVVRRLLGAVAIWGPVEDFMKASRLNELSVQERQRAYRVLADLLVRHTRRVARHAGIPLSPKLVGNCVGNLAGVFDDAFPGYMQAGLAKVVATNRLGQAA